MDELNLKIKNGIELTPLNRDIKDFYDFMNIQDKLDSGLEYNDLSNEEKEKYYKFKNDPAFDEK